MSMDEQRPVLAGLLALVGVAVAVGLVAAVAVMSGAHLLGLGGGRAEGSAGDAGATMYLPRPHKTQAASGPSITLGSNAIPRWEALTSTCSASGSKQARQSTIPSRLE